MSIDWDYAPSVKENLGQEGYRIFQKCNKNFECIGQGEEARVYRVPKGILKITTGEYDFITKNIVGKKLDNVGEITFAKNYDYGCGFSIIIMKEYLPNTKNTGGYVVREWWSANVIYQKLFWVIHYRNDKMKKHPNPMDYPGIEFNNFVTQDLINNAWFTLRSLDRNPNSFTLQLDVDKRTMQDIVDMLTASIILDHVNPEYCTDGHSGNFCRNKKGRLVMIDW
jgi:hypothetical protein